MPKEYVDDCMTFGEAYRFDDGGALVAAPDAPTPKSFRVRVGWDKEAGDVQIATVDEDAPFGSAGSGLFVSLDRGKVNDLIRVLRKARDQTFGRDE